MQIEFKNSKHPYISLTTVRLGGMVFGKMKTYMA